MSYSNISLIADGGPDDLPRTLRREREAREREARERERAAMETVTPPPLSAHDPAYAPAPLAVSAIPASVRHIDVPFVHLMAFFLKAVIAAIPALVLLGVILWTAGHGLQTYFPELMKMQIFIQFPNG